MGKPTVKYECSKNDCGCSSMAERQLPKLHTRVRFPSPAPAKNPVWLGNHLTASDFNHLEILLACTTLRTSPVNGHIFPLGARCYAVLGVAFGFVKIGRASCRERV